MSLEVCLTFHRPAAALAFSPRFASSLVVLVAAGCSGSTPPPAAADLAVRADMARAHCGTLLPVGECRPGELPLLPLGGTRQMVLASLQIAPPLQGFDLDCDGHIDNKLAALSTLVNPMIAADFGTQRSIVVPLEMYGYDGADVACTKFAFYLGRVNEDRDGDGSETSWALGKSDCDDTDQRIHPGAVEDLGNKVDDDCDGIADNPRRGQDSDNQLDYDRDGQSMADGDCDERIDTPAHLAIARMRKRGAVEICGNGIDDDCDGIADNGSACAVFADNKAPVHVQVQSFANAPASPLDPISPAGLIPSIVFADGAVVGGALTAGPDAFPLPVPLGGQQVRIVLSGAKVRMTLTETPHGTYAMGGLLGGVLEAVTLARLRVPVAGLVAANQSLLDGIFAGSLGEVLLLDTDGDGKVLPDIDVDGDGIETFWQDPASVLRTDAGVAPAIVDRCQDGDGTVYRGTDCPFTCKSLDGKMMATADCVGRTAKEVQFLFVDGFSVAINFSAVPATLTNITAK